MRAKSPTAGSSDIVRGSDSLNAFCSKLKILANPQRFRILLVLTEGEAAVGDIEAITNIKQPNLSHELRKLRDNAIVRTRKQSKVVFYSLSDELTRQLVESLAARLDPERDVSQKPAKVPLNSNEGADLKPGRLGECAHFPSIHKHRTL